MKKLNLDLDSLEVQSFETNSQAEALLGTVRGAGITASRCGATCVISCCHTDDVDMAR